MKQPSRGPRKERTDNSPRVAVRRLIVELTRHKSGPDVLCAWGPLSAVLNAATARCATHGGTRLLRSIKSIERSMKGALDIKEYRDAGA